MDNDSCSISSTTQVIEREYSQTSVKWNVTNIRVRAKNASDVIVSSLFKCSDALWQLTLYPYAERKDDGYCCAHLYLNNIAPTSGNSERDFTTFFKIYVFNSFQRNLYSYVSKKCIFKCGAKSEKFRFDAYDSLTPKPIANFLSISFIIFVEENVFPAAPFEKPTKVAEDDTEEKKESRRSGSFLTSLSSNLEELYDRPQLSDVILKSGAEEFQAHRSVLSARSKVFAAMFEHPMKETQKNSVDLVQMEAETVQDMLRYIYCGNVRELSPEQALNLYVAADRYDLQELKTFCRELISQDISVSNVCDIVVVADFHNDESLTGVLQSFLLKNGKEVIKTEKWKLIIANQPALCAKMFEWIFSE